MRHAFFSQSAFALTLALALASPLAAQRKAEEAQPATGGPYVRRFSFGGTFSLLAQPSIKNTTIDQTVASNLTINSTTKAQRRLFGGGLAFQTRLTNRWALATGLSFRLLDFNITDLTYEGTDDTTTTDDDERTVTNTANTSRARLLEVPVLLRYYTKDSNKPGRRRFYEAGITTRIVHGIHSFRISTAEDYTETCCDETPMRPSKRILPGFTAGVGWQMIDEFGIRFIPEIRYTRWMGRTFDTLSTRSRQNQLEVSISVVF